MDRKTEVRNAGLEERLIEALKGQILTTQELADKLGIPFGRGGGINALYDALERNSGHWNYRSESYCEGRIKKAFRQSRSNPDGHSVFVHFLADDEQELLKEGKLSDAKLIRCETLIVNH